MKKIYLLGLLIFFLCPQTLWAKEKLTFQIKVGLPKRDGVALAKHILSDIPFRVKILVLKNGKVDSSFHDALELEGKIFTLNSEGNLVNLGSTGTFQKGVCTLDEVYIEGAFSLRYNGEKVSRWTPPSDYVIPGIFSLLPPLLAIVLAFWLGEVILALFAGIWLGSTMMANYNPLLGIMRALDTHLIQSMAKPEKIQIIFFSLMLGGMVGIIIKSGGMHALVAHWAKYVRSRRSAQLSTWGMGIFIFFDDYANTLMVGQTMRPLTDKLKVSREKLAYLVDSTAAPVASIALISTWIGYEMSFLHDYLRVGPESFQATPDAFKAFVMTIPYRFYSIFTLFFVFLIGWTLRDYGPMWKAEKRALEGAVIREDASPLQEIDDNLMDLSREISLSWYHGLVPIVVTIVAILGGLYYDGATALIKSGQWEKAAFWDIIGKANSFNVLCWSSTLGVLVAGAMAIYSKMLKLPETIQAWLSGVKSMTLAVVILALAWTLGGICESLYTGRYIVELSQGLLPIWLLPAVIFVVAALVAFATGTSWGTMGVLLPITIPLATDLLTHEGLIHNHLATDYGWSILLASIAGVLAGACFGDHCSPISDTTVMSSMASACDHIDHVKTQMPYALTTAGVAIVFGYIPLGLGLSVWLCLPLGMTALAVIVRFVGKKQEENPC